MNKERLPAVGGRILQRSLAEFERACLVTLRDVMENPFADSHLVGVLCDAVRLTRECGDSGVTRTAVEYCTKKHCSGKNCNLPSRPRRAAPSAPETDGGAE